MLPPAPGRLSTTTVWPSSPANFSATKRAVMSVLPPAARGTTRGMVRGGGGVARSARELSGHQRSRDVGAAPRRKRHHEGDGSLGPIGAGYEAGQHECEGQQRLGEVCVCHGLVSNFQVGGSTPARRAVFLKIR